MSPEFITIHMPNDVRQENQPIPQMPDSGQQDVNGALVGSTIGLRSPQSHEIPPSPVEEYLAPYRVTLACAGLYSPFYEVGSGSQLAIGIEDKRLGHPETLDAQSAPFEVARHFASDGKGIRESIVRMGGKKGEDRYVVAKRIVGLGKDGLEEAILEAIKRNSPHDREFLSVASELGIVFGAYMRKLNTEVTDAGDKYRQKVYRDLKLIDAKGSFRTRGAASDVEEKKPKLPDRYNKVKVDDVLEGLSFVQRSDWVFLRSLVSTYSTPEIRQKIDRLTAIFH